MADILIRIIMCAALFLFAGFCIKMGVTSRPHKLKKNQIQITFKKNLPHELYEPLAVLKSSKGELVGTVIWAAILVLVIIMQIKGYGNILYIISGSVGMCYTFWLSSRKLLLYENAVVLKTLTGNKTFYLDEIDFIVSYNILNSFNRGVSYGYRLHRDGNVLVSFPKGSFKQIDRLEDVYRDSRYISEITIQNMEG